MKNMKKPGCRPKAIKAPKSMPGWQPPPEHEIPLVVKGKTYFGNYFKKQAKEKRGLVLSEAARYYLDTLIYDFMGMLFQEAVLCGGPNTLSKKGLQLAVRRMFSNKTAAYLTSSYVDPKPALKPKFAEEKEERDDDSSSSSE